MYIDKRRKVAHPFYSSAKWKTRRLKYLETVHFVCELCGRPAEQVHHKDPLKEEDYFVNYEKPLHTINANALSELTSQEVYFERRKN